MLITPEIKMADVIHMNYMLIPILNRFGITLGFGDKTVQEVCEIQNVDLNFFLKITNTYIDKDYFPKEELRTSSLKSIVNYLRMTHKSYLQVKLIEIEDMIDSLQSEEDDPKYIVLIKNFYQGYKNEFTEHIMFEEEIVFPYILGLEKASNDSSNIAKFLNKNTFSIEKYQEDHSDIEEKLMDLKSIMIKYLTPPKNMNLYNKIIQSIFMLEEDLNHHSRIEEKVLIPKVIKQEAELRETLKKMQ